MAIKNEEFKVGELYRCDNNGAIVEVVKVGTDIDGKLRVSFEVKETGFIHTSDLRTSQELLLTKIKEV